MIDSASWAERLGGDTFLAQTCFRAHKVIRSNGTTSPSPLTWGDLNEIVAAHRLEPPRMRLSRAGEAVPATAYSILRTNRRGVSWYQPQPADFHARLAEGASLVIDAIDQIHPPVREASAGLERFFRTPVQVNAYASWTAEEGFGTHWDDHDVVVLQLEGSKRWKIYGPTRQAPAWRDVEAPEAPTGDPIADIVLMPGDTLYLPRGWWHAVSADQGTASLHLTFGLATQTGAEFLGWLCDDLRASLTVRADVPRFGTPEERADYLAAVRNDVLAALDDPAVLDRWERTLDATHPGRPRLSLPHLTGVPAEPGIAVQATVPRARIDQDDQDVTFAGAGNEWTFALPVAPVLRLLAGGSPATLADLAAESDLTVVQVAEVVSALLAGQAVAVVGGLLVTASLGLGTYRVRAVEQAARTACADGLVWIDTAPNYGSAHQALGSVIADHPRAMVATKTGFLTPDEGAAALRDGLLTAAQVRAGHSLDPGFVRWQTERSLAALGRIDLVFVHNPEHAGLSPTELHPALRDVFGVLEEFAAAGRIGGYGVATWSGFQHDAFSVSELLGLAIEAAGSSEHHLRAVQQPVSLVMARPIALALDGRGPLVLAREAGLITFGSSPLHGGELPGLVTPELAEFIRPGASPGTACLLAAASCPSLDVVLLSAGTAHHWATAKATTAAPLDPGHLRKVTDVLAQG